MQYSQPPDPTRLRHYILGSLQGNLDAIMEKEDVESDTIYEIEKIES